jgi:capsular exopolysaccharide synthesis family protein
MSGTVETPQPDAGGYNPAPRDEEDLASALRSLAMMARRRVKMIVVLVVLGTAAAAYQGYSKQPMYTAQTLVMLEPKESRILDLEAVAAGLSSDTTAVETQVKLLTSPVFLTRLADRLGPPASSRGQGSGDGGDPLVKLVSLLPEDWLIATGLADEKILAAADPETSREELLEKQAAGYEDGLKVKQEGRSLVLSISYTSPEPAEAAKVANTLAAFYIEDQIGDKLGATKKATDWLEVRMAELKGELEEAEQAAERFRSEHKLLESRGLQMDSQQVMNLTNMLVQTRAERSEKETRLRYIRGMQAKGEKLESVTEALESPYLFRLSEQESLLLKEEAELLTQFGDKHPRVQNLAVEKQKIAEKIDREMKRLVDNIQNEIAVRQARERSIQPDIDRLVKQTDTAGQAEVELRQLARQADANRKIYENFLLRYKQTKEQQEIVQANARVIAPAKPPVNPSSIPPHLIVLAGFLGSSLGGVGLAWLTERLDNGLRSGKQIEAEFGLPCLGQVPALRSVTTSRRTRPHRYLLAKPLSAYAETIRTVYAALRLSYLDRPLKVIQITSSVPVEGKTVFATSLATLLAHSGHRTLLLDLDLRHPSVQREIDVPREGALTDYVLGNIDRSELVDRDEESGLDVIAVRRSPQNPTAILNSQRLRNLMDSLRREYDYIVVDSTPVLGVSDSKVTAELADAVLFVVRWEQTTHDIAFDALRELTELKINVSGVVLTQVDVSRQAQYGYGGIDGYYHKYRKYYQN